MQTLIRKLLDLVVLNESEVNIICSCLAKKTYPKGHFLVKEDDISDRVFFIVKGLVKEYYVQSDTKEVCTRFIEEGKFFYSTISFVEEIPAKSNIEALEDTQVLWLSKTHLEYLYDKVPQTDRVVRLLSQRYVVQEMYRGELRRLLPLRERYNIFLKTHSHLKNRLKIKDIASYLNMAPGTLSTVRSKLM